MTKSDVIDKFDNILNTNDLRLWKKFINISERIALDKDDIANLIDEYYSFISQLLMVKDEYIRIDAWDTVLNLAKYKIKNINELINTLF